MLALFGGNKKVPIKYEGNSRNPADIGSAFIREQEYQYMVDIVKAEPYDDAMGTFPKSMEHTTTKDGHQVLTFELKAAKGVELLKIQAVIHNVAFWPSSHVLDVTVEPPGQVEEPVGHLSMAEPYKEIEFGAPPKVFNSSKLKTGSSLTIRVRPKRHPGHMGDSADHFDRLLQDQMMYQKRMFNWWLELEKQKRGEEAMRDLPHNELLVEYAKAYQAGHPDSKGRPQLPPIAHTLINLPPTEGRQ
jgi:hypothetical protein